MTTFLLELLLSSTMKQREPKQNRYNDFDWIITGTGSDQTPNSPIASYLHLPTR